MENKVKIFVSYKNKHKLIKTDIITPIQTGRAIADEIFEDMIGDDTGDNISGKNPKYNELSAQYWVWKHYDEIKNPDYVGFMHYRRHFMFQKPNEIPKTTWLKNSNIYQFEEINDKYIQTILNSESIKSYFPENDILVLKEYDVKYCNKKTVEEQYLKGIPFTHKEIFDKFIEIVSTEYPQYKKEAEALKTTSLQYLCNMFVMKKELFFEYSEILFNVLEKLDSEIDSSQYCEQEMRFLGYMGEMLLTIFINHKKHTSNPIIQEINGCYINKTDYIEDIKPFFSENYTTIAMSCSNTYAPYLAVCLQSIIENCSTEKNYDIVILEKNISKKDKFKIQNLTDKKNISIRFFNCKSFIKSKINIQKNTHYREECVYRLYAAEIFHNYEKIIFTDIDLLFLKDISLLNQINTEEKPIAVCQDYIMNAMYNIKWADWKKYCSKTLKLKNIYNYYNTGVMVIDTKKFQKANIRTKCIDALENSFLRTLEQDALNMIVQDNVKYLPIKWNIMTLQEQMQTWDFLGAMSYDLKTKYLEAKKDIHILHFAAHRKPWFYPDEEYAQIWWEYARKTPFYEQILAGMTDFRSNNYSQYLLSNTFHYKNNILKYWKYKFLRNFAFGKAKNRYITKKAIYKNKIRSVAGIVNG